MRQSRRQIDVLEFLKSHPEGLTANALARLWGWKNAPGRLCRKLEALVKEGVLESEPAPRNGVKYRVRREA